MVDPRDALRKGRRLSGRVLDASAEVSRREAIERARRWRSRAVFILQCAVAASLAYAVARYLFQVEVPLFAPVAAMLCLGMTYGQRFSRALEITVGVAVGAFFGEVFVSWFGMGIWQVAAIVLVSMSVASLVGAGALMVTQAGVQGLIVALLAGHTSTAFGRWFEALIGCVIALVVASVVPQSTLRRPRMAASTLLDRLSALFIATADGLRHRNREVVEDALLAARATEEDLDVLRGHAQDSAEMTSFVPWYRSKRAEVKEITELLEPMDRSIRNARVLIRRAAISLQVDEPVPLEYSDLIWHLAEVTDVISQQLATGVVEPGVTGLLDQLARDSAHPAPEVELSAEVIRAQVRSILVDYFMVLGWTYEAAQQRVLHAAEPPGSTTPAD